MNSLPLFALTGAGLFALGFYALLHRKNLVRKVLALNIMSNGVFLIFISTAERNRTSIPDPVPQAMVLTGIVVAICATAFALSLVEGVVRTTGKVSLPEDEKHG